MNKALVALAVLALGLLACGGMSDLIVTVTPQATNASTETPLVALVTPSETTNLPTVSPTSALVVSSPTTETTNSLCVNALVAVYLRPSPSEDGYPIQPLANGTELVALGGVSNGYIFVELDEGTRGWVYQEYVGDCNGQ